MPCGAKDCSASYHGFRASWAKPEDPLYQAKDCSANASLPHQTIGLTKPKVPIQTTSPTVARYHRPNNTVAAHQASQAVSIIAAIELAECSPLLVVTALSLSKAVSCSSTLLVQIQTFKIGIAMTVDCSTARRNAILHGIDLIIVAIQHRVQHHWGLQCISIYRERCDIFWHHLHTDGALHPDLQTLDQDEEEYCIADT